MKAQKPQPTRKTHKAVTRCDIPLCKLKRSPHNVRQVPHRASFIEALADNIETNGQVQALVVATERVGGHPTGHYCVTAGEARRLAQFLRVKRKQITADALIPCCIDDAYDPVAVSLAENELREQMHPADQFVAFRQLVDSGRSIEEVAAEFEVSPLVVQRRLRLANVAPEFVSMYREGQITLDHLMAFATTEDHDLQRKTWEQLPATSRRPHQLRDALTGREMSVKEPMVRFVGLKAYQKAGGHVRRDLFADDNEAFVTDSDLLRQLATKKLEAHAEKLRRAGCAWVEVVEQLDYATFSKYCRVREIVRAATADEQAKLDALRTEADRLEALAQAADEDSDEAAQCAERAEHAHDQLEALTATLRVPDPQQMAVAGAVVAIGFDGKLRVEQGLLLAKVAKRLATERQAEGDASVSSAPRVHSGALVQQLTAHRTAALQATLSQRPDIALVTLTHRLVLHEFYAGADAGQGVAQVFTRQTELESFAPDLPTCKAKEALNTRAHELRARLPNDASDLFAWLVGQPQSVVLELCAYCVALSLDGVTKNENDRALDVLADAAGLDMGVWWQPTADNYLSKIGKSRLLELLREIGANDAASALTQVKKATLAKEVERRLAGTGWLPSLLRTTARGA